MKPEDTPIPTLNEKLISIEMDDVNKSKSNPPVSNSQIQFDYVQFGQEPDLKLSGLPLLLIPGALIGVKLYIAKKAQIPVLQYLFVSLLVAFIVNYYLIRKHHLFPYLPNDKYDQQLKLISILGLLSIVLSALCGWNNSGAIVVALVWQVMRGNRIGLLGYVFLAAIIGSLMLEDNYSWMKLIQLIPGIFLGYISSTLYTLRQSSTYTIFHEFLLIVTVFLPICFPMQAIVKPTLIQWAAMIGGGVIAVPAGYLTIKMMQTERVSIAMVVFCSILMLLTTQYLAIIDYCGGALIIAGVGWIIYRVYFANQQIVPIV